MNLVDDGPPMPGDNPDHPDWRLKAAGGEGSGEHDGESGEGGGGRLFDGIILEVWSVLPPPLDEHGQAIQAAPPSDALYAALTLSNYDLPPARRMHAAAKLIKLARDAAEREVESSRIDDFFPSSPGYVFPLLARYAAECSPAATAAPVVIQAMPEQMRYIRPTRSSVWLRLTTVEGDAYGVWYITHLDPVTGQAISHEALGMPDAETARANAEEGIPFFGLTLPPRHDELLPRAQAAAIAAACDADQYEAAWRDDGTLTKLEALRKRYQQPTTDGDVPAPPAP